mmetsp:Transcript_15524/g.42071  ORF Transcript_15524/g.42071 Transcript_15524/m.42071 type:complete len:308 (-) Transcript_15524:417-1340(-)
MLAQSGLLTPSQAPLNSRPVVSLESSIRLRRSNRRIARSTSCQVSQQQENAAGKEQEGSNVGTVDFNGKSLTSREIIELLTPFLTEKRIQRIEKVVKSRTKNVLPIVEGLYDMGNLAAVCRSADAFGLASVHCIKGNEKYKQSARTSAGADKWLDVRVWDNTAECVEAVKGAGYQLVVTHLTKGSVAIQDIDWTRPTAFVLGNEKMGVSEEAVEAADACAIIEMSGFVESFNISVAAALVMYEARSQRQRKLGYHGDLSPVEAEALKASMMMRTLKQPKMLITELLSRPPMPWQKMKKESESPGLDQ